MKHLILIILLAVTTGCASLPTYSKQDRYECELETATLQQGKNSFGRMIIIERCLENRAATGKLKGEAS